MKVALEGKIKEGRAFGVIRDPQGNVKGYRYGYGNVNPLKTLLWKLRFGPNGERITPKEAAKFLPQ